MVGHWGVYRLPIIYFYHALNIEYSRPNGLSSITFNLPQQAIEFAFFSTSL